MNGHEARGPAYVVPSYRAGGDTAWYHFLHGNVPGHQIDFIYRAEVPQGPLTRQHFSHLARLMKYIEPQSNERFAFAIGNLSRDDTQYEPGHGGLALIFGLRIRGAVDHAGRQDPPFAHAIAAIDRALDYPTLIASAVAFHRHVLGAAESAEWYRAYVQRALEDPAGVPAVLEAYVARFGDMPEPPPSAMDAAWLTRGAQQPRRIVIVHDDEVSFGEIAVAAARIAAMLYRSDIRWTVISNGREDDVPNGVSVRLLARSELGTSDCAVVHELSDLPDDEAGIAAKLFGAAPADTPSVRPRGWRERFSELERASIDEPPRRSWESAPPPLTRPRQSDPDAVDVDVDDTAATARANLHPISSPPAETTPAPAFADSKPAAPAIRAAPDPEVDMGRSKRASWLVLGMVAMVAVALLTLLATQRKAPLPPPVPTSQPSPNPTPPLPPATTPPVSDSDTAPPADTAPTNTSAPAAASATADPVPPPRPTQKPRRPPPPPPSIIDGKLEP